MKNCTCFDDAQPLVHAITTALDMAPRQVAALRQGALHYYDTYVSPWEVGQKIRSRAYTEIVVNTEQRSVKKMFEDQRLA